MIIAAPFIFYGGKTMIHRMSTPVRVDLVLNQDCNHKCLHCYNPWRDQITREEKYNIETIKHNIDVIVAELKMSNVWSAILTGGEPLLHPDVLFYCIEKLKEIDISMSINTNLTLVTQEILDRLINQYEWSNIILASLPSLNEEKCDEITQISGSYKRIIAGIDLCVKKGIKVGINTVITKKNIDDLSCYVDFVKEHNISYVSISTVIPPLYDVNNCNYYLNNDDIIALADALLKTKQETGVEIGSVTPLPLCVLKDADKYISVLDTTCLAGVSKCSIDVTTGEVFACAHEETGYGNILTNGLLNCWENMKNWSTESNLSRECQKCKWIFICGGECRMMQYGGRRTPLYHLDRNAEIVFGNKINVKQVDWPGEGDLLQINTSFKYRREKFGYVIRCGFVETMVSESLFRLCMLLKEKGTFSLIDIASLVENFEKSKSVINTLIQRKIIVRKEYE